MVKKWIISLGIGGMISAITLYLALRHVPVNALLDFLSKIELVWVIPTVTIVWLTFLLRTIRWQIILSPIKPLTFWSAYHPLMIGFMINCILPGRIGELVRPVTTRQRDQVPLPTGLATIAAERAFDLLILILMFGLLINYVELDDNLSYTFGNLHLNKASLTASAGNVFKLCVLLVAGILMVTLNKTRCLIIRSIDIVPAITIRINKTAGRYTDKLMASPLKSFVEYLAGGFKTIQSPPRLIACTMLSVMVWGGQGLSYYLFSLGCPGISINPVEAAAIMVIVSFFIALPSVPGFWGLWEAGTVFALMLFGISGPSAGGYALANHVMQMLPVIIAGFLSLWLSGMSFSGVTRNISTVSNDKPTE